MCPPPCSTVTRSCSLSIETASRPRYRPTAHMERVLCCIVRRSLHTRESGRSGDREIGGSGMVSRSDVQHALDGSKGLLRLDPAWVPRSFMIPGRRLKLHPDDLYALGGHRGGINERWFSSTTNADNGPGTPPDEGLSYVRVAGRPRFLLKEAVEVAGDLLLGAAVMER